MATTSDIVDALVQGLERAYPEPVFGKLTRGGEGFRVQVDGELWIVRVERAGFWDAPVSDFEELDRLLGAEKVETQAEPAVPDKEEEAGGA